MSFELLKEYYGQWKIYYSINLKSDCWKTRLYCIYKTIDGGKTWTIVANGQIPNYKSCVQYIPNTNGKELIAVGKTGVSFSNDGGNSWNDVSSDSYYTIDFINEKMAWLAGNQKIGKLILP